MRRVLLVVIGAAVVAAGAVYAWQSTRDAVYASTSLLVVDSPTSLAAAGGRPENLVFLAQTYAARVDSRPVVQEAVTASGQPLSVEQALRRTTVTVSNVNATITIRTTGPGPAEADGLNQALITTLDTHVREEQLALRAELLAPLDAEIAELEQRFATLAPGSPQRAAAEQQYLALVTARAQAEIEPLDRVQVLSPPSSPAEPVSPKPVRAGLLAFVIAGAVAAQLLIAMRALRRTPHTPPAPAPATTPAPAPAGWPPPAGR